MQQRLGTMPAQNNNYINGLVDFDEYGKDIQYENGRKKPSDYNNIQ